MISANIEGGIEPPVCLKLAGNTVTGMGVVTGNGRTLISTMFVNDTASDQIGRLFWFDGATQNLIWESTVYANDSVNITEPPIRLRAGDEIRVQAAANVSVTLVHMFRPGQ